MLFRSVPLACSRRARTAPASMASTAAQPVVLVTNDDGIDAPGLRFLVDQLVAQGRYRVLVCAPDTSVLSPPPHPRHPPFHPSCFLFTCCFEKILPRENVKTRWLWMGISGKKV